MAKEYGLGRLPAKDERDKNFPLMAAPVVAEAPVKQICYHLGHYWWGNQGSLPQCVGYAWAHFLHSSPITYRGVKPVYPPADIYTEAQKVDEWEGEGYDGTSVRAGAKVLQAKGFIESYHWGNSLEEMLIALSIYPVVVGINWYSSMFSPDSAGHIKVQGDCVGGHAILVDGKNEKTQLLRMKQSWGRDWGKIGYCYIKFDDMRRLISENAEICLAIEKRHV